VQRWLKSGKLKAEVLPHGKYRVNPFDLVELSLPLTERAAATPKKRRLRYDELAYQCLPDEKGRVDGERDTFWPFSHRPSPNGTCILSMHTAFQATVFLFGWQTAFRVPSVGMTVPLFPFPVYRVLPRSFEYYGNSVTMSLSACRRFRIYARETFSTSRCPVRFLQPVHCRSLTAESIRQLSY